MTFASHFHPVLKISPLTPPLKSELSSVVSLSRGPNKKVRRVKSGFKPELPPKSTPNGL